MCAICRKTAKFDQKAARPRFESGRRRRSKHHIRTTTVPPEKGAEKLGDRARVDAGKGRGPVGKVVATGAFLPSTFLPIRLPYSAIHCVSPIALYIRASTYYTCLLVHMVCAAPTLPTLDKFTADGYWSHQNNLLNPTKVLVPRLCIRFDCAFLQTLPNSIICKHANEKKTLFFKNLGFERTFTRDILKFYSCELTKLRELILLV